MDALQEVRRAWKYLSDLGAWLWRTRPLFWLLVAVVAVFILGVLISSCVERYVRFSGMFLQLIGVILVGIGLRDTRQAFNDLPTTLGAIKQWWFGRPRFRPQHHVIQAAAGSFATSFGAARTHVSIGPNTPLEHRMTILEQQYVSLFDEVGTLSTEMKKRTDELSNALEVERSERQRADNTTHDQLRKAVAEGIPLGSVGVILFLLGIAAGSRNCVDI